MARPTTRKGSSFIQFRQRIPRDVKGKALGMTLVVPVGEGEVIVRLSDRTETIQFSLMTRDPAEGRARQRAAAMHLDGVWEALRVAPKPLTFKQIRALVRDRYLELVQAFEDEPGDTRSWELFVQAALAPDIRNTTRQSGGSGLRIPLSGEPMPKRWSQLAAADVLLARHGIVTDDVSRERLGEEIDKALSEAALRLKQVAEGDYSPDQKIVRFPALEMDRSSEAMAQGGDTSLEALLAGWWREAEAAGLSRSTYVNYRGAVRALGSFLGRDDGATITSADVVRFKDHRLTEVSARTVKDHDLAALKSVFRWAQQNGRIKDNPTRDVTVRRARKKQTRSPGYSDDEAKTILRAASTLQRGGEGRKMYLAKRWAPWLMAYTGARVGEVAQLRKQDLVNRGDHWAIILTPEAGTVKGGKFREVPLHPHLVDLGFVAMVNAASDGHLFVDPNPLTEDVRGPLKGVTNRLSAFARAHVADRASSPTTHGGTALRRWGAQTICARTSRT